MGNLIDITGQKFNRLTVISRFGRNKRVKWNCVCDCGNRSIVFSCHLLNGHTKSCGCLNKELIIRAHTTHGMYGTRTYTTWRKMIERCYDKKNNRFHRYGGRGIRVCDKWRNFEGFYNDVGSRPKGKFIDRINNDCNYEPGNVRWVTATDNIRNSSTTKLNIVDVENIRKLLKSGKSQKYISALYSVTPANISSIKRNNTWR